MPVAPVIDAVDGSLPRIEQDTWAIRAQRRRELEISEQDASAATGAAFNSSL
jgi:hypothetical protein